MSTLRDYNIKVYTFCNYVNLISLYVKADEKYFI